MRSKPSLSACGEGKWSLGTIRLIQGGLVDKITWSQRCVHRRRQFIFRMLCILALIVSPFLVSAPNLIEWQYIPNTDIFTRINELESLESARRSQIRIYLGAM
jgi:hypothetical protein